MEYTYRDAESHIARCVAASRSSEEAFFRAGFLALTSIQVPSKVYWTKILAPCYSAYAETRSITAARKINRASTQFCKFDFQRKGLKALRRSVPEFMSMDAETMHESLTTIPGLAPVKSGFVTQMARGKYGCYDTVNRKLYGDRKKTWKPSEYREFISNFDCISLWQKWCMHVAARDGFDPGLLSESHATFVEDGVVVLSS